MGTLRVNTITNLAGEPVIDDNPQGIAKAWVNFDAIGTIAIQDSFNVSSITDVADGNYAINLTTPMSNTKYVTAGSSSSGSDNNATSAGITFPRDNKTVSSFRVRTGDTETNDARDSDMVMVAVFGS